MTIKALNIRVIGLVQGVGFRPFIHRLAYKYNLRGYVINLGGSEVEIHVEGDESKINRFLQELNKNKPPPAIIENLLVSHVSPRGYKVFSIKKSDKRITRRSAIPPDIGICEDCLREIMDPNNRRYGYPWNSCAWCGPRFSIMYNIPYDRENTSMREFPLCNKCMKEYTDIRDERRYHAQGISCPICGPKTYLLDSEGKLIDSSDPIDDAAKLLEKGHVLAIKGLGGYHIAGLATQSEVVEKIRRIKNRPTQPLALMARDCSIVLKYTVASKEDCDVLKSPRRPILLINKRRETRLPESIAPNVNWLGVMLPYTGLHALILNKIHDGLLIMTSGNRHGFPMCKNLTCLIEQLGGDIDYILDHNRQIVHRTDDSVLRRTRHSLQLLRRSRGYAPYWLKVKKRVPEALALGAELQTAGGISFNDKIVLTQYIGDLDNSLQLRELISEIEWFINQYKLEPSFLALDMHPAYSNRRVAPELAEKYHANIVEVQHHCAHALSLIADRNLDFSDSYPAVIVDGSGYGADRQIWGGEALLVEGGECSRVSHIKYFPLPGGDLAVREPLRSLIGILSMSLSEDETLNILYKLNKLNIIRVNKARLVYKIASRSPLTSSAGRVADAISALLGLSYYRTYEGEPAIVLESALLSSNIRPQINGEPPLQGELVDPFTIIYNILDKLLKNNRIRDVYIEAANGLYWIGYLLADKALEKSRNNLLLSGGAAVNEYIALGAERAARDHNVSLIQHRELPPGDGGIAAGQLLYLSSLEH